MGIITGDKLKDFRDFVGGDLVLSWEEDGDDYRLITGLGEDYGIEQLLSGSIFRIGISDT